MVNIYFALGDIMESRTEDVLRFADVHAKARISCGKSQEWMAMELGVSKKTVQNWEKGISSPTFYQSLEWFRALKLNPFPSYLEYYYNKPNEHPSDSDVEEEWNSLSENLPTWVKRAILFIFFGRHGSSPASLVQLTLAHIHTPLKSRVVNATIIKHNYEMAQAQGDIICQEHILPDMDMLDIAINEGKKSAINNEYGYTIHKGEV